MKKIIICLLVLLSCFSAICQPVTQRGSATITVMDARSGATFNMLIPRYTDTTNANTALGIDSCGAIIFTYDVNACWFRQCSPKKWVLFGSVNGNNNLDTIYTRLPIFVDITSDPPKRILTLLHANGLLSPGIVTLDSCMKIDVSPAIYYLNYIQYTTALTTGITIAAADPSNPRIDAVIVDSFGLVSVLTGTPAVTPVAPQINPSSQILLTTITIPAAATCLTITQEIIYDQHTGSPEWTISTSGTITEDADNTDNPYHLTKAMYIPSYHTGSSIIFTKPSGTNTVVAGEILKGFLYFNGGFLNQIQGQWYNGSTAVSNPIVLNPYFNPNDSNQYQILAVPLSAWNFSSSTFNKLILTFGGNDTSLAKGLYMDYIQLQTGLVNINPTLTLTTIGSSGAATYNNLTNILNIPVYGGGSGGGISHAVGVNGLNNVNDSTISLGGTLINNTTITQAGFTTTFTGSKVVFDSTTTGTDYPRIGVLLNENFSSGSIPSGWTNGGLTVSHAGAKATITGAAAIGAPNAGNPFLAYTSGLQFNTKRMPYEKLDFQMSIVPTTKSANALVGVFKGVLGNTIYSQEGFAVDLSNGPNSGRVTITFGSNGAGGNSVPTFTTLIDSTSKMNFSTGDSLILYFKKNGWSVVAGIINKTTGKITASTFNQRWNGSGGLWNLVFLNGTYVLTNAKVNVLDRKGGIWIVGDSQWGGYGVSQQSRRQSELLFQDNPKYFGVWGLPALSNKYFDTSGMINEMITDVQPSKIVFGLGYNDESENFTAAVTKVYADTAVFQWQRAGITVGISGIVPRAGITTDIWNDSLASLAVQRGCDFYDIRTPLKLSTGVFNPAYAYDLHLNDSGAIVVANVIRAKSGDSLLSEMAEDTLYQVKIYGISNSVAQSVVPLIGYDRNYKVVSVPNTLPTPATWIQNLYTTNTGAQTSQYNAQVYVQQALKSDSALIIKTPQGLRIGFNNDDQTATTGANINIGNFSTASNNQTFNNLTGSGNIFMSASSVNKTKIGNGGSVSGINNTLINYLLQSAISGNSNTAIGAYANSLTSGSDNVFIGPYAGTGITTGTNNINILSQTTGQTHASGLSNTIVLGDMTTYDPYVAGDIVLSNGYTTNNNVWFGSKGGIYTATTLNFPATSNPTTNAIAAPGFIRTGRSSGLVLPGNLQLQTWTPVASGTTYQSTAVTKILMDYMGIGMGTATKATHVPDALLDLESTTQSLVIPRMTTTQRDAVSTGVLSLTLNIVGSGYTNGNVALSFSGGGGTGAAGYVIIGAGIVVSVYLTDRGTGYTSAPSVSVTSGGGSGAVITAIVGATQGATIYNLTTNKRNMWDSTRWVEEGKILSNSATLDFGNTSAGASTDLTITVTGAADGDVVSVGVPNGSTLANGVFTCWVSAANTVTVRFTNTNLVSALDPASGTFKVKVFKD